MHEAFKVTIWTQLAHVWAEKAGQEGQSQSLLGRRWTQLQTAPPKTLALLGQV